MISMSAVVREAAASARSQPVASTLTVLMVVGMIVTVMLTTGRTVAAEQQVLSSIDSAGTRTVTVRAESAAGITSDVLDRIDHIDGIEWVGAFSGSIDATNTLNPEGVRVPTRYAYGADFERLSVRSDSPLPGELAYASELAMSQLGLIDGSGAITLTTGQSYGVAGRLTVPDFLAPLQPLVIIPLSNTSGHEPINIIIVIAETPELVAPVSDAVLSVIAPTDPTKVSMQTSEALAQLRALIQGQLGSFSRGLVLAITGLTGTLVAILLYGLVMMRRKDFGRRRALGATRGLIVVLLVTQTGLLALAGIALGLGISLLTLTVIRAPLPGMEFTAALTILALAASLVAALVPALIASLREPIRELRVP